MSGARTTTLQGGAQWNRDILTAARWTWPGAMGRRRPVHQAALPALPALLGRLVTYTCGRPGAGVRLGADRDRDGSPPPLQHTAITWPEPVARKPIHREHKHLV